MSQHALTEDKSLLLTEAYKTFSVQKTSYTDIRHPDMTTVERNVISYGYRNGNQHPNPFSLKDIDTIEGHLFSILKQLRDIFDEHSKEVKLQGHHDQGFATFLREAFTGRDNLLVTREWEEKEKEEKRERSCQIYGMQSRLIAVFSDRSAANNYFWHLNRDIKKGPCDLKPVYETYYLRPEKIKPYEQGRNLLLKCETV